MQRSRIRPLIAILVVGFIAIGFRLVQLQGLDWRDYRVQAESTRRHIRYQPAPRGSILDRSGQPLAEEVPTHDVVFTLLDLEPAARTCQRVARLLRSSASGTEPRFTSEHLAYSLQRLRTSFRSHLLTDLAHQPQPWIDQVPEPAASALAAAIAQAPQRFPGVQLSWHGTATVTVVPSQMFAGEIAALGLARRLGERDPLEHFARRVWLPYQQAQQLENRTARLWKLEEERVLFGDVPFDVVLDLNYHPERYPGLRIRAGSRRTYPACRTLAQLVGYLGRARPKEVRSWREEERLLGSSTSINDIRTFLALRPVSYFEDSLVGRTGLEAAHEAQLRGRPGARILEVDRHGRERGAPLEEALVVPGHDVTVTLDLALCQEIERILVHRFVPAGSVIVGNPTTGEVLGWSALPSFDSEHFSDFSEARQDPRGPLRNRPLWALSPGSTFKMVAAVGALQEGLVTPHETILCTGFYDPQHRDRLRCRNHSLVISDIDVAAALARSCNTFFYHLGARRLHVDGLTRWAQEFGFGEGTGLEGLSEIGFNAQAQHAESAAIGKGRILATPTQLLRYACCIANRGLLPRLRLLKTLDDAATEGTATRRLPVDPWVWDLVIEGMRGAVSYGTASGPQIGLDHFDCAVKTGTAVVRGGDIAWIVGFAPVSAPQVAFVVCLEDQLLHGGEAAGPIAAELLEWLAAHRGLPLRATGSSR